MQREITQFFLENPVNEDMNSFLDQMINEDSRRIKLINIESKYNLHKLHHKTTLTWQIFSVVLSLLLTAGEIFIIYICMKNLAYLPSRRRSNGNNQPVRFAQLSDVTPSSRMATAGSCVGMQGFDNMMAKQTTEVGNQKTLESLN